MGGLTLWLLGRMEDDTLGWVTYCAVAEIVAVLVLAVVERILASPHTRAETQTKAKVKAKAVNLAVKAKAVKAAAGRDETAAGEIRQKKEKESNSQKKQVGAGNRASRGR